MAQFCGNERAYFNAWPIVHPELRFIHRSNPRQLTRGTRQAGGACLAAAACHSCGARQARSACASARACRASDACKQVHVMSLHLLMFVHLIPQSQPAAQVLFRAGIPWHECYPCALILESTPVAPDTPVEPVWPLPPVTPVAPDKPEAPVAPLEPVKPVLPASTNAFFQHIGGCLCI